MVPVTNAWLCCAVLCACDSASQTGCYRMYSAEPSIDAHLRLVHGPPAWHAQHEGALVRRGCAGCDAESSVPAAVDALRGVLEVQLHTLQAQHATDSQD